MKRRRMSLTDDQWLAVEPLLKRKPRRPGRPPRHDRTMVDAVLWVLRTGATWRELPRRFGPWQSAYHRYAAWRASGVWRRIEEAVGGVGGRSGRKADLVTEEIG